MHILWNLIKMGAVILSIGFLPAAAVATFPDDADHALVGEWSGSMTLGPKEYPISVWFDVGAPMTGRIQLVGMTSDNNPLTDIIVQDGTVTFALASRPPQLFSGTIHGEAIDGTIDFGGFTETFSIQRVTP